MHMSPNHYLETNRRGEERGVWGGLPRYAATWNKYPERTSIFAPRSKLDPDLSAQVL